MLVMLTASIGGAGGAGARSAAVQLNGLFVASAQRGTLGPDYAPAALRGRYVTVDFSRLANLAGPGAERLTLNLFSGTDLTAVRYETYAAPYGFEVWLGRVEGQPLSQVTLVVGRNIVTGNVTVGAASYQIRYAGAGLHSIYQVDPSIAPPTSQPIEVPSMGPPAPPASTTGIDAVPVDIDVMVVWTSAARNAVGGRDPMLSRITLAVAETNTAYTNSQVNQDIDLVYAEEVVYTESGSSSTDLGRLRSTSDGFMDEVHAWRNQYGADLVSLIFNNSSVCGQAYLMGTPSPGFASSAFSVVYWSCATGYYSFAHELGHNMGSHHDRANAGGTPSYPYSYGFQAAACSPPYRTIMAYACPSGCTRLQYFSNPDVMVNGCPSGVPISEQNSAHNALSLSNTAPIVGAWRGAPGCQPGPDYLVTSSGSASIVPGTDLVPGSICDNCVVNIPLPFSYELYGVAYSSVNASVEGNLQFAGSSNAATNTCLPAATLSHAILSYWDDLTTNIKDLMGIYTSVTGTAPNRVFNIEWRAGYVGADNRLNFQVRLFEGQPKFEIIYGPQNPRGHSATVGVQEWTGTRYTQYSCNTQTIQPGTKLTFDRRSCR
jgi:peptidyl-Asp metalloendopeptidase